MGPSLPKKKKFSPDSMSMDELNDDNCINDGNETPIAAASINGNKSSNAKMSPGMRGKMSSKFTTESVKMKLLFESSVQRKLRNV